MPTYFLKCHDKEGSGELRAEHLDAHRVYLAENSQMVRLAGPLLNDTDEPVGSLIVVSCGSLQEARTFGTNDPFSKAGLFSLMMVREFEPEVGFSD